MMLRAFRILRLKRELSRNLAARKALRQARQEAAERGVSTQWSNRYAQHLKLWGRA